MKRKIPCGFAVLFSTLWLLNATAQTTAPTAQILPKAPADVNIDGQLGEWNETSFIYNNESKIKYIVSSDDNYLYLTANLDQRAIRQKVLGAGVTLSINTEGKKKKSFSLTYPVPVTDDNLNYMEKQHARQTHAKASGFKGVDDDMVLPDPHGFKAAFAFKDEGGMGYEVAIPLKALNMKPGTSSLNINITINALDKPSMGGDAPATSPAGGGGRGGSRGGGGRGGSRPPSGAPGDARDDTPADLYTATEFWLTYTLPGK
ncbi:hypothetical protein BEL04_20550 [Mucilaginibacter sp. PPCGB 2223]|uniref:hypothetical protein n=1 Tax=Mucilaginibacter sp. PPCGB 2223 TaxID=1886027 RepID=UPI0008244358|nr:hypothetical protein [Mucilaginibacter sp. PPCGB 2223]OCX51106.1 hypothetical protein BEL04_20550 [Mucilaginibacter sp. PPCGB 2223]